MDALLETIKSSLGNISIQIDDDLEYSQKGISLLALKNESLLAYLHHVCLVIAGMIERTESNDSIDGAFEKTVENSVIHRVVMDKGVKGLETKIAYQIEKALRAYLKTQKQAEEAANAKIASQAEKNDEENSDEEALSFKPNPFALTTGRAEASESDPNAKYVPPKISAATPFTEKEKTSSRRRKNVVMEEYLEDARGAPMAAPSIGSTIMDGGRGGERTDKDRRKQQEIQNYEEENYVRLPGMSKKEQKRAARQRQRDAHGKNLFGEDWGFLETVGRDRDNGDGPQRSKRRKTSAWERAKKKATL